MKGVRGGQQLRLPDFREQWVLEYASLMITARGRGCGAASAPLLYIFLHGIIGTLSEKFHELSVSNTWTLNECKPGARHEFSGNGVIGTLSDLLKIVFYI